MKDKHKTAYMECAFAFSKCSVSTRLQVGTVIVKNDRIISCGYNALPVHIGGPLEGADGSTLPEVRHSEKNALMGLIRSNESAIGASLFCTHACCKYCAIDIVDAGIVKVYYSLPYRADDGIKYLQEHGVEVEVWQI